jgi:hypothetical protein
MDAEVPPDNVPNGIGVKVGWLAILVSESPAWTVCATAVEIVESCCADDPHAETSNMQLTSTTRTLYFPNENIQMSFLIGL